MPYLLDEYFIQVHDFVYFLSEPEYRVCGADESKGAQGEKGDRSLTAVHMCVRSQFRWAHMRDNANWQRSH